jgi:hypothetical protein
METAQICQKCNKNEGMPYQFYFGEIVGKKEITNAKGEKSTVELVEAGGSESVVICDNCIRRSKMNWLFLGLALIFLGAPFMYAMFTPGAGWLFALVFIGVGILGILLAFDKDKSVPGSTLAASVRKMDLAKQGFNKVWTPGENKAIHFAEKPEQPAAQ